MYRNILKKDLGRKRAMNVILLIFIILASMFVSSSMNNIISVTSALDGYFDMADAPDYFAATMNKSNSAVLDKTVENAKSIDHFRVEEIFYLPHSGTLRGGEALNTSSGTHVLQSDKDLSMNYFLEDGSILESVPQGKFYMTDFAAKNAGLQPGEKVIIEIDGISRELSFAGSIKDAVLGSKMTLTTRFIVNTNDFEAYASNEMISAFYGGKFYYIYTSDVNNMLSEISGISDSFIFTGDRPLLKFSYVFDMIVTGILLVVSLILIAVAFVVLRFTITFTLSEEFREIGVMKAIGISNLKIRGLYLVKYAALAVIGAAAGLILSFPFGEMLLRVSSPTVILDHRNTIFINIFCVIFVIAVILLFCFGCTGKVKRMTPMEAIRNGQTGERFRQRSLLSLGRSKLKAAVFLAANDIVSSPRRYGIITLTFFLCLSLLLILSTTVTTLKSKTLLKYFSISECDLFIDNSEALMEFMVEDGRRACTQYLEEIEETLAQNGMPAECSIELAFNFAVKCREQKNKIMTYQGTGTTMDMYTYTEGAIPQNENEIAITRLAANSIKADIGDTVTIETIDGEKKYIITAIYQTMNNQGIQIRFHTDAVVNYIQASGGTDLRICFSDHPDEKEIRRRIDKISELYPEFTKISTAAEKIEEDVGVADTLNAIKYMAAVLTIILAALITVLMERSFIAKEQGEIALMKAIGMSNGNIYAYHTARFALIGMIAVIIGEICAMPLTHLCIDPIFRMMGLELAVDYVLNPLEMYLIFPLIILVITVLSALLTSLYTRRIKSSDTANIE